MVVNLYNKNNTFYLITVFSSALTSIQLITVFNVPTFLALTLIILSSLVIMFLYKMINDYAEMNRLVKENNGLEQQLKNEKTKVANAQKKIQGLENIVQDKEVQLCDAKKKVQNQKINIEKKAQDLKGLIEHKEVELTNSKEEIQKLRDKIQYKETELTKLLEKVKKESSTLQYLQNQVNVLTDEKLSSKREIETDHGEKVVKRSQSFSMSNGEEIKEQEAKRRYSSLSILSPKVLKRVYDSIKLFP